MATRPTLACAAACAMLASIAYADDLRPGQFEQSETSSSSGNWVFGTRSGDPFVDNFENYTPGDICIQAGPPGGWETGGVIGFCGDVSTEQAYSGDNSLKIIGIDSTPGDDTVHQHDIVGGVWTYSVMTFVPNDATGSAYFLLLAGYPPEEFNWTTQIRIDANQDIVESEWGESFNTPLIRGQWVELRIEIDMPSDTQDYFYGGVAFDVGQSWRDRVGSLNGATLRAIDLYANEPPHGISRMYWDDISLTPEGFEFDPCDCNCDGAINAFDIEPFLSLLFDPDPVNCSGRAGDTNGDGVVNAFDIEPFLECLFP